MKKEQNNSVLLDIANLKKELLMIRIKASSGEAVIAKDYKNKKKEIARLFTKINSNKKSAQA
ncbi:MAG: 50S ribosomal protein L29 [Rickettsiales bacterium]|nr:50S ribosomal protein L29 [Rickettsiales bacterium]